MAKKLIRLTEGDLHRIIENSVHTVLNELDNRTVTGYIQGRGLQSVGNRDYSDAMKRRAMRDYVNGKYEGTITKNPREVANLNAENDAFTAKRQYDLSPFDKAIDARKLSTYKNGKWGYDPSKFDDYK